MLQIVNMFIEQKLNRPRKKNSPSHLAVHWTADKKKGADADNVARYFKTTTRQASAHYVVDDHQIVRCIPENEVAYSVGAKSYTQFKNQYIGRDPNSKVISVEICVNADGKFWDTYSLTAHLCADILRRHGWGIERLIRHYDVTHKDCPRFFVFDDEAKLYLGRTASEAWKMFRSDVARLLTAK